MRSSGWKRRPPGPPELHPFLDSPRLAGLLALAHKSAPLPTPVLIRGEEGTGADELAALVHAGGERRKQRPFVVLRCRGVSEVALDQELTGDPTAPGAPASAVARARSGTLFIDEVANLGPRAQAALATLVDVDRPHPEPDPTARPRVIAGTSVDLKLAVKNRAFRADLHDRLAVLTLDLPRLRDRPEDILPLARKLLALHASALGGSARELSPAACQKLEGHDWSGNCTELQAVLERAVIVEDGPQLGETSIALVASNAAPGGAISDLFSLLRLAQGRPPTMNELERAYLVWLLQFTRGNRTAASRLLGVSYPTIMKKILDYGIDFRAIARVRQLA